jgi:hypothetical protein
MRVLHADAVITGDAEVIADGAVVVDARGEIMDYGAAGEVLPRHAGAAIERVQGVLVPGLVNAHTHLELSALRGEVPGGAGFVPWVEQLIGARAEAKPDADREAIDRAVDELVAFGTAAVGEVTNSLTAVRALARKGVAGWVFHEVFGVEPTALEARVAELPRVVEAATRRRRTRSTQPMSRSRDDCSRRRAIAGPGRVCTSASIRPSAAFSSMGTGPFPSGTSGFSRFPRGRCAGRRRRRSPLPTKLARSRRTFSACT